ncbi:MAG: hypothetical protein LUE29_08360 [Lachnospiraceae bacterium]|nr:hypothetical protein [Lachnospiraceae bacterium]
MPATLMNSREKSIYEQYQNVIAYFIVELEVRDTEYPVEIFNEIRAIFTHLSRYKIQESEDDLMSAERHVKRAILDCFKYMCVSYAEEITQFRNAYRKVDLKIADNGKFLPKLDLLEHEARAAYIAAKNSEIRGNISEENLYQMYENTYDKYKKLSDFLVDSNEAILFASSHSKRSNFINIISIIVTAFSIVVAIIFAFI